MNALHMTEHARARMQQRAIPPRVIEALVAYGRGEHDHRGGVIFFFDKAARERVGREIERYLDAYAVVAGTGEVITVGHRDKRIRRH